MSTSSLLAAIAKTTLLAGTLDIAAAHIIYFASGRSNPLGVLLFVASGILGKEAFVGGVGTALFGLLLHYTIAAAWTTLFFLLYPYSRFLRYNVLLNGIGYGVLVWCVMNVLVLPLTAAPTLMLTPLSIVREAAILILCIGLPIAWSARAFFGHAES